MKDFKLTLEEYQEYLTDLKSSVFKVLPLYEIGNIYLASYLDDVIDEVIHVKIIIENLPNSIWYVKSLANLESLKVKIKEDNHAIVKKKVLNTTNLIQKEIEQIENSIVKEV